MIVLTKKYLLTLFLVLNTAVLFSQVTLTVQGTIINNSDTGIWAGVNIQRNVPTTFIYKNNSITSANNSGYMLQAGDEGLDNNNNNLDGEIITGNKFAWKGTDLRSITHGLFTGYNLNAIIKYNYLDKVPLAIIRKSNGMTDVSGVIAYNIVRNPYVGIALKGINGIKIYNNTFYSERSTSETYRGIIDIYANDGFNPGIPSAGTVIKNNIFYTKYQITNIYIYDNEDLVGFQSDYNVFYCESGSPMFNYLGVPKTFAQWQALGYDTHSVVVNPDFIDFTGLVPVAGLFNGTNLGTEYKTGLAGNASWVAGSDPATSDQGIVWQAGAYIIEGNYVNESPSIVILSPGNTNSFSSPATISITAAASDTDGVITKVEFYNGNKKLGETAASPYSYAWSNVSAGTYSLTAAATDNLYAVTFSTPVTITVFDGTPPVNAPPTVTISSPGTGSSFTSPATVIITANAFDSDGIRKVEFLNGALKLGETTSAPFLYTWEGVNPGTYIIRAIATDNSMATSASKPVEVHVEPNYDLSNEFMRLFPNPNSGQFTVELIDPLNNEKNKISITNVLGGKVFESTISGNETLKHFELSHLKTGMYILTISGKEIIAAKRFIVN